MHRPQPVYTMCVSTFFAISQDDDLVADRTSL